MTYTLEDFVRESNRIEGILREPTIDEIAAHYKLSYCSKVTVKGLAEFVGIVQPYAVLRDHRTLNVRVGSHIAPEGGPEIVAKLEALLWSAKGNGGTPHRIHCQYEVLHPFTDGNGRSGRALWLWQMGGIEKAPLGFLHHFYYQTLEAAS